MGFTVKVRSAVPMVICEVVLGITKRIFILLIILAGILFTGITGYHFIEGWTYFEGLYMTVITIATIGYMEVRPLSVPGRVFTMFLIIIGTGILVYAFSTIVSFIIEGELFGAIGRRKMEKEISKLKGHYIICGAGSTGRHIIDELLNIKEKFVVIEKDEQAIKKISEAKKILYVTGNATDDDVLHKAGIDRAKGLICALSNDEDNLFITVTAKSINSSLRIVTRTSIDSSERKLKRAGADTVVSTSYIGGLRMISEMMRPTATNFLDIMLRDKKGIRVTEAIVTKGSRLAAHALGELEINKKTGAMVLAIKDGVTGEYVFNPGADAKPREGDALILLADVRQMEKIKELSGRHLL